MCICSMASEPKTSATSANPTTTSPVSQFSSRTPDGARNCSIFPRENTTKGRPNPRDNLMFFEEGIDFREETADSPTSHSSNYSTMSNHVCFLLFIFWEIYFCKIKYLKNEVRTFVVLDAEGPDFLDLSVMGRNLDSTTIPRNDEKI